MDTERDVTYEDAIEWMNTTLTIEDIVGLYKDCGMIFLCEDGKIVDYI